MPLPTILTLSLTPGQYWMSSSFRIGSAGSEISTQANPHTGLLTLTHRHPALIPICVLRCHSEMGKIGHRVKKLRIILKLSQLVTKRLNHGIKGSKDTVRKSFFP